jgi:hypothetical protein
MPSRPLDLEVMNRGARAGRFSMSADPDDLATLQGALRSWLEGDGWDEALWGRFELHVRESGGSRIIRRIRP